MVSLAITMGGDRRTKKARSIDISNLLPEPRGLLKGPKGPFPETQAKVLDIFIAHKDAPVFREELLEMFNGNRNPVDKAIQLINARLKKFGIQISGYQIYVVEPSEPENQLRLFG